MRRYVLVRHALALGGAPEDGLSPEGWAQAQVLACRLAGWTFDAAWSSDMARAEETAERVLVLHPGLDFRRSPALREVDGSDALSPVRDPAGYAAWEGATLERLAGELEGWLRDVAEGIRGGRPSPVGTSSPWGEGRGEGDRRREPAPTGTAGRGEGGAPPAVLVVSHAGPLRVLVCLLLGLPPAAHWRFRMDPAGVSVVDHVGEMGTLMLLNDRCHLPGEGVRFRPGQDLLEGGGDGRLGRDPRPPGMS